MKMLSIGANVINYKDKQTKEPRTMLCLHCVKKNVNTRGLATEQFFVKDDSPLYSNIMAEVKGALDELVNRFVDVDRDSKGWLENFELLDKDDNAVTWNFLVKKGG